MKPHLKKSTVSEIERLNQIRRDLFRSGMDRKIAVRDVIHMLRNNQAQRTALVKPTK